MSIKIGKLKLECSIRRTAPARSGSDTSRCPLKFNASVLGCWNSRAAAPVECRGGAPSIGSTSSPLPRSAYPVPASRAIAVNGGGKQATATRRAYTPEEPIYGQNEGLTGYNCMEPFRLAFVQNSGRSFWPHQTTNWPRLLR